MMGDGLTAGLFGRTNERVPRLWFGLMPGGGDAEALVSAVDEGPAIVDVSGHAGLFGHLMHGRGFQIATIGGAEIANAADAVGAGNLVGAHLVETLSALGRPAIDYYFLKVGDGVREEQLNGALNVLDEAKTDGVIRFMGIYVEGDAVRVGGLWRFHDAFEAAMVGRNPLASAQFETVKALAAERRAGLVTCHPFNWGKRRAFFEMEGLGFETEGAGALAFYGAEHPVLVGVRSAEEVRGCRAALGGAGADPAGFAERYRGWEVGR